MPNVATFVRARLTPIDAADTGLSRTDIIARPQRPRTMFQASQNMMMPTTDAEQVAELVVRQAVPRRVELPVERRVDALHAAGERCRTS